jgi:hypothetical protein
MSTAKLTAKSTALAILWLGALTVLSSCNSLSPLSPNHPPTVSVANTTTLFSDERYARVLQAYVNETGLVDYPALQANPQPLQEFVATLGTVAPSQYAAWSKNEKIAFLINAYNALTLAAIIEQKPLKNSIKDIFGVWNFTKHRVMGTEKTLDNIEHNILRKDFQEPRIHAALVCAARSCPPLRREPYVGSQLSTQLDDQVRRWLASGQGLQINRPQRQVKISAIFKWFGEDWQPQYSTTGQFKGSEKERAVLNFISNYVTPPDKDYLARGNYRLQYLNYDWSLNRQ